MLAEPWGSELPSLGEEAARRGIWYGATPEVDMVAQPPEYPALLRKQARLLIPGYVSWSWVAPTPTTYDFSREQRNIDFARSWGYPMSGAHLLWQHRVPNWFKAITDRSQAERAVRHHVAEMTSRFRGRFLSWNAVNESIDPEQGRPDGLRSDDAFLKIFGPTYHDLAFHAAKEGDPAAIRVYNDFGFENDSPEAEKRRISLLRLLDGMLARRVPIDAVGLQAHVALTDTFNQGLYRKFLKEISSRGLKILITEFDVNDRSGPADPKIRDQRVADYYAKFLEVALDEVNVIACSTWGISDRYTWIGPTYDATLGRPDGLPCRPLPFDSEFRAKPAFYAAINAFRNAPKRPLINGSPSAETRVPTASS